MAGERYDERLWLEFDYFDYENEAGRNLEVGTTASWTEAWSSMIFRAGSAQNTLAGYIAPSYNWIRVERKFTIPYNTPRHVTFQDAGGAANTQHVDNVVVSYSRGNHKYNKDPYRFTHPGF